MPFKNAKGEPYLETHHIVWLAKGGDDTAENTVALCPNCHKKMHIVDDAKDVEVLKSRSSKLLEELNQ
ncbi:TPA: HNH endonuclease [Vibrio vulnificus]|uniref:HNH endonuclease n=1 Tax=Vibrio vulnificus TaxID=672 RepID=UPI0029652616|nr:HNH endonuclease [Vibrio vulnificus]